MATQTSCLRQPHNRKTGENGNGSHVNANAGRPWGRTPGGSGDLAICGKGRWVSSRLSTPEGQNACCVVSAAFQSREAASTTHRTAAEGDDTVGPS